MTSDVVGTTLPAVPDPARERRRTKARTLRDQGLTYAEIAKIIGVEWWTVQDDLREQARPAPVSLRFPSDVEQRARGAADRMGVSFSQFVVESVRQRLDHQDRNRERLRELRHGEPGPETDA